VPEAVALVPEAVVPEAVALAPEAVVPWPQAKGAATPAGHWSRVRMTFCVVLRHDLAGPQAGPQAGVALHRSSGFLLWQPPRVVIYGVGQLSLAGINGRSPDADASRYASSH
jgi:hypothetical protein